MLELDGYESHHTLIERGVMMHHPTTGKVIWTEEPES
jgi:hypothetical protein